MSSEKHKIFVDSPVLDDLLVIDVPGIGQAYSTRLQRHKICKASDLYKMYSSTFKKNQTEFTSWLQQRCQCKGPKFAESVINAFQEWEEKHGSCQTTRSSSRVNATSETETEGSDDGSSEDEESSDEDNLAKIEKKLDILTELVRELMNDVKDLKKGKKSK